MVRLQHILLLLILSANLYSETITSDSLLQRVKGGESIYDVIDKININDIDYKDVYYNEELKPYILQLLDEDSYRLYDIETYLESSFGTDLAKKNRIEEWLRDNNSQLPLDSVMSTPNLYRSYLDTAYTDYSSKLHQNYQPIIPNKFEKLLSLVRWPEVYEEYHRQWINDGGNITSKRFYAMLCMHDPYAISLFDKYVDDLLQRKDGSLKWDIYKHRPSADALGSYRDKLWLRGLEYTNLITFTPFPQDHEEPLTVPFNIKIVSGLIGYNCPSKKAKRLIDKITIQVTFLDEKFYKLNEDLTIDEYISIGKQIKENAQLFRDIYEPYIEKEEQEELYWKQNMPYYKTSNK